jgi:hypothetical protein
VVLRVVHLQCAVVANMYASVENARYLLTLLWGFLDARVDVPPCSGHRTRLATSVPCLFRCAAYLMLRSRALPVLLRPHRALLEREKADLLQEMMSLPQNAVVRRINELVKRARAVKVHAYIVHYLKKQMPYVLGTGSFECLHLHLPGLVG